MNYYIFIYTLSITFSILGGIVLWRQYRNLSGFFFLLSSIGASLWFLAYFLFFSGLYSEEILLLLSRFAFAIGVVWVYSLLAFVYFFSSKPSTILLKKELYLVVGAFIGIVLFYLFTDNIIAGLTREGDIYREVTGRFFFIHIILHSTFIVLFIITSFRQTKKQTYLNRIRLENILLAAFTLIASLIVLQLILPLFGIWILEKEIALFFALFSVFTIYAIKRYYFPQLGYGLGRVLLYVLSVAISILSLNLIKLVYFSVDSSMSNFWRFHDDYGIIDTIIGLALYYGAFTLLSQVFRGNATIEILRREIQKLEERIPYIMDLDELNLLLRKELGRIFTTSISYVQLFDGQGTKLELERFLQDNQEGIFMNDIVFIEERCYLYDRKKLVSEIPPGVFIVFPLFGNKGEGMIGIFTIGFKPFGDFYTINEIQVLHGFVAFLELHLKYVDTYQQIQDFSKNLDKKVDEKTIEYNHLISKQKEFISTISHEIKSPIAGAILQVDSIMDDISDKKMPREDIKKELELLAIQLMKTGDLLSKLFSVQYFDTHAVTLFKERVQIKNMLNMELDIYEKIYENVHFTRKIDPKMSFIDIDKIQLQQVITNLVTNAVKFSQTDHPEVLIEAYVQGKIFHLSIEDNGNGFSGIDIANIFEKYTIGSSGSVGLGIGLYLCKRIVEMHGGCISASIGPNLHGACIDISIPV